MILFHLLGFMVVSPLAYAGMKAMGMDFTTAICAIFLLGLIFNRR
jgi:hypothetical protein